MRFSDVLHAMDLAALRAATENATRGQVERVLARERVDDADLPILFSRAADAYLEELAMRSAAITERRFGKAVTMYAPLYVSNECINKCTYCGFSMGLPIKRVTLAMDDVRRDAGIIYNEGFRHLLLVAGEHRRIVSIPYMVDCVKALDGRFASVAIEIQPLRRPDYETLIVAGVDGLAIYQETYEPDIYPRYHPSGPKKNFDNRLRAIEEGGEAGMRSLGIGALLGIAPWRVEATLMALHGRYLMRKFWRSKVAASFPRIQPNAHRYDPDFKVYDRDLVHMFCGMRLALPDAELVLSTRESPRMREGLLKIGLNRISAGSKTNPGGYSDEANHEGEQFVIADDRSPAEVAAMLAANGYEPVWKDFDRRLVMARD